MDDTVVKDRYFTTPLKLEVNTGGGGGRQTERVRPRDGEWAIQAWEEPLRKKGKGDGKGKAKGKGRGKGAGKGDAVANGCAQVDKDNKPICYAFNQKHEVCKARKCRFLHVCGRCTVGKKPMYHCHCKA